jgi:glycosyltransferase involved in cell wall biosynthesis
VRGHILYWGDAPTVATGFGVVARHVLAALSDAGYEIDCLGLNAVAEFPDPGRFPYRIVPGSVFGQDPFGYRALARALLARRYDLLLAQNDLQVIHTASGHLETMLQRGADLPPIACYYPVDCSVRPDLDGMLRLADASVTCTEFGRRETEKVMPERPPLVIPHGVDGRAFRPLPDRMAVRQRVRDEMGIPGEALLVCSVAVNSIRKDLARTIAAFARFREARSEPAALYLHTIPADNGLDLAQAATASGLTVGRDVIFPEGYHPIRGIKDSALNELYNAADVYFTTTLGEGWGLPITEAMAAGLPVVGPRHSSLQEICGEGRAVLYECRERIWVDNSGYRPLGLMDDIVVALERAVSMPEIERRRMTEAARDFVGALDWKLVAPRWVSLVERLMAARREGKGRAAGTPAG